MVNKRSNPIASIIECPQIVIDLKNKFGTNKLTVASGLSAKIDFVNSVIHFKKQKYIIDPIGEAAQELIVDGGLEEWVKKNL